MIKNMLTYVIICSFIGFSALSVGAVVQYAQERGYITVNTTAESEIIPNTAEIAFSVKTSDNKSIQKATLQNKEITENLYATLNGMINSVNGDYIKTANYNASPIYTYNNNKKSLEKYEVVNRVIVHTKSIDKVGELIDIAVANGANGVDALNFSISDYDDTCNDLIQRATQKATKRAGIIAKSTASQLDGVKSFTSSCSSNVYNQPRLYAAKNVLSAVAEDTFSGNATSISGGTIKINATVNAQFFVK